MDFFAAQDHARRQTKKLVIYFIMAVVGIIVSIYAVCAFLFSLDISVSDLVGADGGSGYYETGRGDSYNSYSSSRSTPPARSQQADAMAGESDEVSVRWWNPQLLGIVSAAVLLVILGASATKIAQLRGGGGAVARSLGGRKIDPGTRDTAERRLMNVVEEMALASGTPVPEVYVLDEEAGINAFAAGHSPHDAAVAVTRGCMESLNRDELQGVMAHEFSHILNGDMRLNVRLIGILFGILVLAVLGEGLMRSAFWAGGSRRNSKDNSGMVLLILGIAIMAIGYIGILFGRLIQSAISRQREFLADASAVQFTRYPDGIADALIKIGKEGSTLRSQHAQETAHMFFASGIKQHFGGGFATHPPLADRIRAIKPDWNGEFTPTGSQQSRSQKTPGSPDAPQGRAAQSAGPGSSGRGRATSEGTSTNGSTLESGNASGSGSASAGAGMLGAAGAMRSNGNQGRLKADVALAAIGTLAMEQIAQGASLHGQARQILGEAGNDPQAAKALLIALMLGEGEAAELPKRLEQLKDRIEPEVFSQIPSLAKQLVGQDALHLPLLELAMPALGKLEKAQLKAFGAELEQLAMADAKLTFGELAIVALMRRKIARKVAVASQDEATIADAAQLADAFSVVLSAVIAAEAEQGAELQTESQQQAAFSAAVVKAPLFVGLVTLHKQVDNHALLAALVDLSPAAFALKKQILAAAAEVVLLDGQVTAREGEWLRLIAACLDCPMPPVAVQTTASGKSGSIGSKE